MVLIVTEEMVPNIQEMLETAGIKVEREDFSEESKELKVPDVSGKEPDLSNKPHFICHSFS